LRRQLEAKYRPHFGADSELLSAGIVKSVLGEIACDPELASYINDYSNLIEQQTQQIRHDYALSHAFSILLSFSLVQLGPKYPEKSAALIERTLELGLLLRSTREIVTTDDPREFLEGVQKIAQYLAVQILEPSKYQL